MNWLTTRAFYKILMNKNILLYPGAVPLAPPSPV